MSTEADKRVALSEAKRALTGLTAHLIRLSAGVGNVEGMRCSLEHLWMALSQPGASAIFCRLECGDALKLAEDPEAPPHPIEQAFDRVLVGALGMVASRLERDRLQEVLALSELSEGMRALQAGSSTPSPVPAYHIAKHHSIQRPNSKS